MRSTCHVGIVMVIFRLCLSPVLAQTFDPPRYDMGSPVFSNIWVDPVRGDDLNTGTTSNLAVRTLNEAWGRIPSGVNLTNKGVRIWLMPGDYPETHIPAWWDARYGTYTCPVVLQGVGTSHATRLHGYIDAHDCRYLYFINFDVVTDPGYGGGGNVIHLADCQHVLIRDCLLDGFDGTDRQPQETLKANQTQYLYVENSEIKSAFWYPLDFMVVQYGHIVGCKIHDAGEWCVLIKGGSAYFRVEGNEIYNGHTGGFVAGNGAGFNYLTSPWLHYEAYDIKFVNNIIHHTGTVGMGVNGGYNILLAYNTLYQVGTNDHVLEILHGARACNEDPSICSAYNAAGGWGATNPVEAQYIPCQNVYIYNNIIYNQAGTFHGWQHFNIDGPVIPPAGCNITNPSLADTNLRIKGNLIWSGSAGLPLGIEDSGQGCQPDNPACNETQLRNENAINSIEPQLMNSAGGDFRPVPCGSAYRVKTFPVPDFPGGDRPQPPLAPVGYLTNAVPREYNKHPRYETLPPGAFTGGSSMRMETLGTSNGQVRFRLTAEAGYHYQIDTSSNLVTWSSLVATNSSSEINDFHDALGSNEGCKLYRSQLLP